MLYAGLGLVEVSLVLLLAALCLGLEEVVLEPVLVVPVPGLGVGLVLSLVGFVAGALEVAAGGLGLGLVEVAVVGDGLVLVVQSCSHGPVPCCCPCSRCWPWLGLDLGPAVEVLATLGLLAEVAVVGGGLVHVVPPLSHGLVPCCRPCSRSRPWLGLVAVFDQVGLDPDLVDPGPGLVLSLVEIVTGALEVADPVLVLVEVADPVLVLLEEVGLVPFLVDPGPGLVLSLVEAVAGALVVAAGGLGLGLVEAVVPVLGPVSPDLVLVLLVLEVGAAEPDVLVAGVVDPAAPDDGASEPDGLDAGVVVPDVLVDGVVELDVLEV